MPLVRRNLARAAAVAAIAAAGVPAAARAQTAGAPAEVVVIGTVHSPTPAYSGDSLLAILERLRPAVILVELDSTFFDDSSRLRPEFRAISMENAAASRYAERTGTPLWPYDVAGRNQEYERHDYFNRQRQMSQAIGRLDGQHGLGPEAQGLLRELDEVSALRDAIGADRPRVINSAAADSTIRLKQRYGYEGLARVIALTPALAEFTDFWGWAAAFWDRRNQAMRANIVRAAGRYPGRRIVVICGYEHRYYLRTLLREDDAAGRLGLREYWEYGAGETEGTIPR